MKEAIDLRQSLRVFNKIINHGAKSGQESSLKGLHAATDFDGYTLHLHDDAVELYIYFHNSFRLQSPSKKALNNFLLRLQAIDDTDYSAGRIAPHM